MYIFIYISTLGYVGKTNSSLVSLRDSRLYNIENEKIRLYLYIIMCIYSVPMCV